MPRTAYTLRFTPLLILLPAVDIALSIILARTLPRPLVLLWIGLACVAGGVLILSARNALRHSRAGGLDLALAARQLVRLVAGALLLFPGPLSDIVAALLVFPRSRQRLTTWVLSRTLGISSNLFSKMTYESSWPGNLAPDVFPRTPRKEGYVRDAEFEVVSEAEDPPPGGHGHLPEATKPKD